MFNSPFRGSSTSMTGKRGRAASLIGSWARKMLAKRRAYARRSSAPSRQIIASRIHTFKRMGTPFVFRNSNPGGFLPLITSGGANANTAGLTLGNLGTGNNANSIMFGGSLSFSLNQISNPSEITSLFDNYRIKSVLLKFILSSDNAQIPIVAGMSSFLPIMHYTVDPDDAAVPTDMSQVLQNSYARTVRLGNIFDVGVSPRANAVVAANPTATTVTAGGILPSTQWLDCGTPNIFHYGLKFWVDQFPSSNDLGTLTLQVIPTFIIEAKNVV